jgi:predicted kinase
LWLYLKDLPGTPVELLSVNCFYILCGTAFSGKTTAARELCRVIDCVCVSLDEINSERGLHGGDGIPAREWQPTHEIALQRLSELMAEGYDIVLDDTCCFRWRRSLSTVPPSD